MQPIALQGPLSAYSQDGKGRLFLSSETPDQSKGLLNYYYDGQVADLHIQSDLFYWDGESSFVSLRTRSTQLQSQIETAMAAEASRAFTAENLLAGRATVLESFKTDTEAYILTNDAALLKEVKDRTDGLDYVATQVSNEMGRAVAAEGVLSGRINDAETKAFNDVDFETKRAVQREIDIEAAFATADAAEALLRSTQFNEIYSAVNQYSSFSAQALADEIAARIFAQNELLTTYSGIVQTETNRSLDAEGALSTRIDTLTTNSNQDTSYMTDRIARIEQYILTLQSSPSA